MTGRLLAACALAGLATPAAAQTWRTLTTARSLEGPGAVTVNVRYGAGKFRLASGAGSELYRLQLRYDEDKFTPVREYDAETRTLRLGIRSVHNGTRVSLGDRHDRTMPTFDLALSPDVPIALNLEMGAVEADADLGGLSISRVTFRTGAAQSHLRFSTPNPAACDEMVVEAGASEFHGEQLANANCDRVTFRGGVGEVDLDFSGAWRRSMAADINVAIGQLNLKLPRDVGVEVRLNRVLASFDAAGFQKRGSNYYSANFASARYRLTLNVNATFGGIDVTWLN